MACHLSHPPLLESYGQLLPSKPPQSALQFCSSVPGTFSDRLTRESAISLGGRTLTTSTRSHPHSVTRSPEPTITGRSMMIGLGSRLRTSLLFEYHSGHTIKDLRSSLRRPGHVQARIELATLAAARFELRSTDIARAIQKHPTSVARWISIGLRKQVEDSAFRERIDLLDRRISRSARNDA